MFLCCLQKDLWETAGENMEILIMWYLYYLFFLFSLILKKFPPCFMFLFSLRSNLCCGCLQRLFYSASALFSTCNISCCYRILPLPVLVWAYRSAWRDIPTPFLFCSFCLQRTLIARTLCAMNCSKTKPKEEGGGGGWGLWPSVFTLFCSNSV